MTLTEVMKSGKKFRRPNFRPFMGQETWLEVDDNQIVFSVTRNDWKPRAEDITATDWVLEDEKLEFTFNEIYSAVIRLVSSSKNEEQFKSNLKTALGFKQNKSNTHHCDGYFCSYCDEGNNEDIF